MEFYDGRSKGERPWFRRMMLLCMLWRSIFLAWGVECAGTHFLRLKHTSAKLHNWLRPRNTWSYVQRFLSNWEMSMHNRVILAVQRRRVKRPSALAVEQRIALRKASA